MMQYLFQAWGNRGPKKYRDMLLNTGTEEIGHVEMLSTAVALNLEGAPLSFQEEMSKDATAGALVNGMKLSPIFFPGLGASPDNRNGVPFNAGHRYASGNIACATAFPRGWARRRRTATAWLSTRATSTPAATSRATCTATWRPRRPGARWRRGSTT